MILTTDVSKYLNNLIWNDLLYWEDFWEITRESIDKLKDFTFRNWISERIWFEQYSWNLRKILKYQIETWAGLDIQFKTIFHILSSYVKYKNNSYWIDLCIITFLNFWECFGFDCIENNPNFFNENNKNSSAYFEFRKLTGILVSLSKTENEDLDFITLFRNIFDKIGYDQWYNFYKIANKSVKFLHFSIVYLLDEKWLSLNEEQKRVLYNPRNFEYKYHPLLTSDDVKCLEESFKRYYSEYIKVSEHPKEYVDLFYKSHYFNVLSKKSNNKKEIIKYIFNLKMKYKYLENQIKWIESNIYVPVTQIELESMEKQYLYLDLMESRFIVMNILEEEKIEDLRKLFNYFYKKVPKQLWYKNVDIWNYDSIFYRWYLIFELSRIFLHKQIKKEQFDWIHSIYEYSLTDPRVAVFYNLTLWKFSFSFLRIWTEYYLQWYNLLLKQLFKNSWLWTIWDWLSEFRNIWKEATNILGWSFEDTDEDIARLIFQDEWISHEFKASLSLDWRKKLSNWKIDSLPLLSIVKPIVSILNWNTPWKIIVWIREWEKVIEEIEKEHNFTYDDLKQNWIKSDKRSNFHYLTWIDFEVKELLWNKSDDNLKQWIDRQLSNSIEPTPQIWWWTISLDIKKFLWKKILIVDVIPWNTVFALHSETKKWKEIVKENLIYVRKNWSDEKLVDPLDIVKLVESKKQNIKLVYDVIDDNWWIVSKWNIDL